MGAVLLVWLAGCGGSSARSSLPGPPTFEGRCPEDLEGYQGGQCEWALVPLNWDEPAETHIELFTRWYAAQGNTRGTLWLLDGGPGASGMGMANKTLVDTFTGAGFNLAIPTHRGVFPSTELRCDLLVQTTAQLAECATRLGRQWGDDLVWFSSRGAVKDIEKLILQSELEGPHFIMGASYGSWLALRLMQDSDFPLAGVIGASGLPLSYRLDQLASTQEATLANYFSVCAAEPECNAVLPMTYTEALDALQGGCPSAQSLLAHIPQMLLHPELRLLVPGAIARGFRCDTGDQEALGFLLASMDQLQQDQRENLRNARYNGLMNIHQVLTEFVPDKTLPEWSGLSASLNWGEPQVWRERANVWPTFGQNIPDLSKPLRGDVPLLLVNGGLDFQAPAGFHYALQAGFTSSAHHLVVLPHAGHGLHHYDLFADDKHCSFELILGFLGDPWGDIDDRCVGQIPIPLFMQNPVNELGVALSVRWFGTEEIY